MALGFLLRRAPATMSRKRGDFFTRLISSFSSFSSSSSPARSVSSSPAPRPPHDLVGGIRVPASVRHLISAAERTELPSDVQGAEYAPIGFRQRPSGAPDQRYQSGFNEEGRRSSPPDVCGFHGRTPLDPGFDGRSSAHGHSRGVISAANQHLDGLSGGTSGGLQTFDGARNWQQNLDGFARGGNPPENFRKNLDSFQRNAYGGSNPSLDQGIEGFSERPPPNFHPGVQPTEDGRAGTPRREEIADGSNVHNGTIEELDAFLSEGKAKEAVQVLGLLEKGGRALDLDRCLKLIDVCGDAKAGEEARTVHRYMAKTTGGDNIGVRINNRILSVFCKCELLEDAHNLFETMPERNITSWETLMLGLADNGMGEEAIDLFNKFTQKGLTPDGHMFIALFRVCSSLCAVDEGMLHFQSMNDVYGISPTAEHYAAVVRMHGEAGYLDEALEFIGRMPREPGVLVWETLMNCARIQGNVELGDRCEEIVQVLDPDRLSSGEWKTGLLPVKASDLAREKQRKANLLEVRSRVHEYRAGDTSHPEKDRIYALIKGLAATLREGGYVPDTRFVLHDVEQESKEEALLAHSERLATAYGLISSSARSPIRIIKNLRICGDCHGYMKVMSKAVGRELIIRDAKRFHHFKDGVCSCRDYW